MLALGVALINYLPTEQWSAPFSLFFVRPSTQKKLNLNRKDHPLVETSREVESAMGASAYQLI